MAVVPVVSLLLVAGPALATPATSQAAVELYVQTPYDFETETFDLNSLEYVNLDPVFATPLTIPYDAIENQGRALIAALTKDPVTGHASSGSILTPDADWQVRFDASFAFSKRGQPALLPWKSPTENGTHVRLDAQVAFEVTAHVHISPTVLADIDFDVPMRAVIGLHGAVSLALYPVLRADDLDAYLTLDDTNLDIVGLDGTAIGIGGVIGAIVGHVTGQTLIGGVVGAILGSEAIELAKTEARRVAAKTAKTAIQEVNGLLSTTLNGALQPKIAGANDILTKLLHQPIPGTGMSFGGLQAALGMTIDVRSTTVNNTLRTVATARFTNTPANQRVTGNLRFPKTACVFAEIDEPYLGHFRLPIGVTEFNTDLSCAAVDARGLRHDAWYGENPDRVLGTGEPANNLATWSSIGSVATTTGGHDDATIDCGYAINDLPNGAILDLHAEPGSWLYQRLGDGARRAGGRFVSANVGGLSIMVDHVGKLVDPYALDLGGSGPASVDDCPSEMYRPGIGLSQSEMERLHDAFDPEKCPQCGFVQQAGEDRVYVLTQVDSFLAMAHTVTTLEQPGPTTVILPGDLAVELMSPSVAPTFELGGVAIPGLLGMDVGFPAGH